MLYLPMIINDNSNLVQTDILSSLNMSPTTVTGIWKYGLAGEGLLLYAKQPNSYEPEIGVFLELTTHALATRLNIPHPNAVVFSNGSTVAIATEYDFNFATSLYQYRQSGRPLNLSLNQIVADLGFRLVTNHKDSNDGDILINSFGTSLKRIDFENTWGHDGLTFVDVNTTTYNELLTGPLIKGVASLSISATYGAGGTFIDDFLSLDINDFKGECLSIAETLSRTFYPDKYDKFVSVIEGHIIPTLKSRQPQIKFLLWQAIKHVKDEENST